MLLVSGIVFCRLSACFTQVFVPLAQQGLLDKIPPPPDVLLPRVRLMFNDRPRPITASILTLRIPPLPRTENFDLEAPTSKVVAEKEVMSDASASDDDVLPDLVECDNDDDDDWDFPNNSWESGSDSDGQADDEEDLRRQVRDFAKDTENIDQNEPTAEETGPKSKDKAYLFCPPTHRLPLMHLFAKHTSQHSLLPKWHGSVQALVGTTTHCHIAPAPESNRDHAWLDLDSDNDFVASRSTPSKTLSPISLSPNKSPLTGHNGLMCSRAGGDAGFDLDDNEAQQQQLAVEKIRFLADRLHQQLESPDTHFMKNALHRIQPALQLADEIKDTKNRRTMPVTNGTGSASSKHCHNVLTTSMIGYRFPESNSNV
ncbi:hypothetical protein BC629DRAFT_1445018 [Irpex lacteus]|nr:hypothetical protein BC629DRAFT_1445018 [Irpex lacteus]